MENNVVNFDLPVDLFDNDGYLYDHGALECPDFHKASSKKYYFKFHFPNGYGASVIKGPGSYGYEKDLWELAVLQQIGDSWRIAYGTDITDDVEGYLSVDDVKKLLDAIRKLEE